MDAGSGRDARSVLRAGLGVAVAVAAAIVAVPATAGPSSNTPGAFVVTSSALLPELVPGESTRIVVEVANVGGSDLSAVTFTANLPAALTYVPHTAVAVRTSTTGATSHYSDAAESDSVADRSLGMYSPGLLVSEFDRIDLAPGDTLRVSFVAQVNPALAPGIDALTVTSIATSGRVAVASDTVTLTVLEQALVWAYDDPGA